MGTKIVDELPKCDFRNDYPHPNGDDAFYDAPTIPTGTWANMCKDCALVRGNLRLGTKFELRKEYQGEIPDKPVLAIEPGLDDLEYWEGTIFEGIREPVCPSCGEIRRMEPDAGNDPETGYAFTCEGCGTKCKMREGLC
jgi:rubrerythrin